MTWQLSRKFGFEAAHMLPHHDGKCARLHGHSFKAEVVVEGSRLRRAGPKAGMVVDYADIDAAVEPVRQILDHSYLNESTGLENPSSEELCVWIYERVREHLPGVVTVIVEETCRSRCVYRPSPARRAARRRR